MGKRQVEDLPVSNKVSGLADHSLYQRVPNLDFIRANRVKYFNFIGAILLTINSLIWGAIWYKLHYPLMSLICFIFLPISYVIYKYSKTNRIFLAFTILIFSAAIWIMVVVIAASGPGYKYGGSVHAYFLTLAAVVFFSMIGRPQKGQVGGTISLIVLFLLVEFSPIEFSPVILLEQNERQFANYLTWSMAISSFFIFYFWLARDVNHVEHKLNVSNARMEELLENILPPVIAKKLSDEGKTFAEGFANCTVLFADIVNFSELSRSMSANGLVALLNNIFADFDDATQQHGLEKIKTIGDAYMVAAGVPNIMLDHANKMVELAQEFLTILEKYPQISVRIGINSGPVTAGVIGKRKFIYDLWGDTVNLAARMEQHGVCNRIHITSSTYELIKDKITCEKRKKIEVKGSGELQTYLVV